MISLYSKFHAAGLIRSGLNKALFRVEQVQEKEERKKERRRRYDFKHTLASLAGAS